MSIPYSYFVGTKKSRHFYASALPYGIIILWLLILYHTLHPVSIPLFIFGNIAQNRKANTALYGCPPLCTCGVIYNANRTVLIMLGFSVADTSSAQDNVGNRPRKRVSYEMKFLIPTLSLIPGFVNSKFTFSFPLTDSTTLLFVLQYILYLPHIRGFIVLNRDFICCI